MVTDQRLAYALAVVAGRLHTAVGEKRCGCGQCAYWVRLAALAAGISRVRLEEALPAPARPEPMRRRQPRELRVRISDHSTVRVRGRAAEPSEGLAALLARLHVSDRA